MKPHLMLVEPMLPAIEAALDRDYQVLRLFTTEGREAVDREPDKVRAVVTGGGSGLGERWFDRLPSLGIIAVNGIGTDKVNLDRARAAGVHVTTTPGVLTDDVADTGMALILAVLRRLVEGDRLVRSGAWAAGEAFPLGTSLKGRRLGVLGLGRIGRALARRGEAFGMNVSFYNRSPAADVTWDRRETPAALARSCDVLAVCIAANEQTRGIVDRNVLNALGPEGVVINVSRGSVIEEDDLLEFLRTSRIKGAGLDVFLNEPRIDPEFLRLGNVVLSPHQGSATRETRLEMGNLVLSNLAAFFEGKRPPTSLTTAI